MDEDDEEDWVDDPDLTFEEVLAAAAKLETAIALGTAGYMVLPPEEEAVLAILPLIDGPTSSRFGLMENASLAKITSFGGLGTKGDKGAAMWRVAEAKDNRDADKRAGDAGFWAVVKEELDSKRLRRKDICAITGFSREYLRTRMLALREDNP